MFSALDVSTSALVAQRTRMNAISSNLANMSTPINESGDSEPYQARRGTSCVRHAFGSPCRSCRLTTAQRQSPAQSRTRRGRSGSGRWQGRLLVSDAT